MTGDGFRRIRKRLRLTQVEIGIALGSHAKSPNTVHNIVQRYESGHRVIPVYVERLMTMFRRYGVPEKWLPRPVKIKLGRPRKSGKRYPCGKLKSTA